jgi:two-component system chemotaxis response regulator CheY
VERVRASAPGGRATARAIRLLPVAERLSERRVMKGDQTTRMRTLIVEDDCTSRQLLTSFLAKFGDCHVAADGPAAVASFRAAASAGRPYDLVCLDAVAPELNGSAALRSIREAEEAVGIPCTHPKAAKVIMTTTLDDIRDVFYTLGRLFDAYLVEPVDTSMLFRHLKTLRLVR